MNPSQAWLDLGNREPQIAQHHKAHQLVQKTNTTVSTIIGMLEVAHEQSEIPGNNTIRSFFGKAPGIMNHLMRTGEIAHLTQADELRLKVMKELGIPINAAHQLIQKLFNKNIHYEDRLNLSLQSIVTATEKLGYDAAIREQWNTKDKQYFSPDIRTIKEYSEIIKAYYYQKNGREYTRENVEKIKE